MDFRGKPIAGLRLPSGDDLGECDMGVCPNGSRVSVLPALLPFIGLRVEDNATLEVAVVSMNREQATMLRDYLSARLAVEPTDFEV